MQNKIAGSILNRAVSLPQIVFILKGFYLFNQFPDIALVKFSQYIIQHI